MEGKSAKGGKSMNAPFFEVTYYILKNGMYSEIFSTIFLSMAIVNSLFFVINQLNFEDPNANQLISTVRTVLSYMQVAGFLKNMTINTWILVLSAFFVLLLFTLMCFLFALMRVGKRDIQVQMAKKYLSLFFPLLSPFLFINIFQLCTMAYFCSDDFEATLNFDCGSPLRYFGIAVATLTISMLFVIKIYGFFFLKDLNPFIPSLYKNQNQFFKSSFFFYRIFLVVFSHADHSKELSLVFFVVNMLLVSLLLWSDLNFTETKTFNIAFISNTSFATLFVVSFECLLIQIAGWNDNNAVMIIEFIVLNGLLIFAIWSIKKWNLNRINLNSNNINSLLTTLHRCFSIVEIGDLFSKHILYLALVQKVNEFWDEYLSSGIQLSESFSHSERIGVESYVQRMFDSETFKSLIESDPNSQLRIFNEHIDGFIHELLSMYFWHLLRTHKKSHELQLLQIFHLYFCKNQKLDSILSFFQLYMNRSEIDSSWIFFEVFKLRKIAEKTIINDYNSSKETNKINLEKYLSFNKSLDVFKLDLDTCSEKANKFWQTIREPSPNVSQVYRAIFEFLKSLNQCERFYSKLLEMNITSKYLFDMYISFVRNILFDHQKADRLNERILDNSNRNPIVMKDIELENYQINDRSEKAFFLLNGEKGQEGEIIFASNEVASIFKYDILSLIHKKIEFLMPPFEENHVQNWIVDFFRDPTKYKSSLQNKLSLDYFLDKEGYLHIVLLQIKLLPNFSRGISFSIFVWPLNLESDNNNIMMLVNIKSGFVYSINAKFAEVFGITSKMLEMDIKIGMKIMNLQFLCPELLVPANQNSLINRSKIACRMNTKKALEQLGNFQGEPIERTKRSTARYSVHGRPSVISDFKDFNQSNLANFVAQTTEQKDGVEVNVELVTAKEQGNERIYLLSLETLQRTKTEKDSDKEKSEQNSLKSNGGSAKDGPKDASSNLWERASEFESSYLPRKMSLVRLQISFAFVIVIAFSVLNCFIFQSYISSFINFTFGVASITNKGAMISDVAYTSDKLYSATQRPELFSSLVYNVTSLQQQIWLKADALKDAETEYSLTRINMSNAFFYENYDRLTPDLVIAHEEIDFSMDFQLEMHDMQQEITVNYSQFTFYLTGSLFEFTKMFNAQLYFNMVNNIKNVIEMTSQLMEKYIQAFYKFIEKFKEQNMWYCVIALGVTLLIILISFGMILQIESDFLKVFNLFALIKDQEIDEYILAVQKFREKFISPSPLDKIQSNASTVKGTRKISKILNLGVDSSSKLYESIDQKDLVAKKNNFSETNRSKIESPVEDENKFKLFKKGLRVWRPLYKFLFIILLILSILGFVFTMGQSFPDHLKSSANYFNSLNKLKISLYNFRYFTFKQIFLNESCTECLQLAEQFQNSTIDSTAIFKKLTPSLNLMELASYQDEVKLITENLCENFLTKFGQRSFCSYHILLLDFDVIISKLCSDPIEYFRSPSYFVPEYIFVQYEDIFIIFIDTLDYLIDKYKLISMLSYNNLFYVFIAVLVILNVLCIMYFAFIWKDFASQNKVKIGMSRQLLMILDTKIVEQNVQLNDQINKLF